MRTKSRQNRDTNLVQQGEKLECYLCAKLPRPPFNEFPRNPVCAKSFGGKLKSMTILFLIDQKNPLLFSLSHVSYQPYFIAFFKNRLLSSMYRLSPISSTSEVCGLNPNFGKKNSDCTFLPANCYLEKLKIKI